MSVIRHKYAVIMYVKSHLKGFVVAANGTTKASNKAPAVETYGMISATNQEYVAITSGVLPPKQAVAVVNAMTLLKEFV